MKNGASAKEMWKSGQELCQRPKQPREQQPQKTGSNPRLAEQARQNKGKGQKGERDSKGRREIKYALM